MISYASTTPHQLTWKINTNNMDYVGLIVGAPRITPILKYIQFQYFIILFAVILGYIFIHSLLFTMMIKFNKPNSKFYQLGVAFTRYFTTPMIIFFMIPINEIILLTLKTFDCGMLNTQNLDFLTILVGLLVCILVLVIIPVLFDQLI